MPFADLMRDTVDLLKTNGAKVSGLRASVQRDKVFMDANGLKIEPQDLLIRRMSNGAEEIYRVIDPGFHEAFHGIKAHYQMSVRNLTTPEAKAAVQNITVNITGHNARVNQNSVDNSTNFVQIDARAVQYIAALRDEIAKSQLSEAQKVEANEIVDEVDNAFSSGKPKKSVVTAMLSGLPHLANIATIAASIAALL